MFISPFNNPGQGILRRNCIEKKTNENADIGIPKIFGVLIYTGLISALLLDKAGDIISWITLLVPVIVTIRFCFLKNLHKLGNKKCG